MSVKIVFSMSEFDDFPASVQWWIQATLLILYNVTLWLDTAPEITVEWI